MNALAREALLLRQAGYCWWCLTPIGDAFAAHHRRLRKHGGTDDLGNLIALHHECHNLRTNSVHLSPASAYGRGFLVHSWDDPMNTPVTVQGQGQVLLHSDGTTTTQGETHNVW